MTSGELPPRDARAEAEGHARLLRGEDCQVQILEPAPPAVNAEPWFADAEPSGPRIVGPFGPLELRWETLAVEHPSLRAFCEERWLGPYRRLEPLPATFAATRSALHSLAEHVISPARAKANGKIGLRFTRGGFGTPFFAADAQVRIEDGRLVIQQGDHATSHPITTLAAARERLGPLAGPAGESVTDTPLHVDPAAASAFGDLYGFASSVLEALRYGAAAQLERSRVQLWPEHFDVSVELGGEASGKRAGYGVSPGDELHDQPYLYVVPWGEVPPGERWQAHGFAGAQLDYAELLAAPDQRALALEFFSSRLAELTG
jgi:hypothetical protein